MRYRFKYYGFFFSIGSLIVISFVKVGRFFFHSRMSSLPIILKIKSWHDSLTENWSSVHGRIHQIVRHRLNIGTRTRSRNSFREKSQKKTKQNKQATGDSRRYARLIRNVIPNRKEGPPPRQLLLLFLLPTTTKVVE